MDAVKEKLNPWLGKFRRKESEERVMLLEYSVWLCCIISEKKL